VIGREGQQLGVLSLSDALARAREAESDLVLVAPNAQPPVAKIMDFGKYRYEIQKKEKESKKKQKKTELKQMKFRPKIDENDYQTKLKHIRRFIEEGHLVRVTIMFRGREMAFTEKGLDILNQVVADTANFAKCVSKPKLEGRDMHMSLSPLSEEEVRRIEKQDKIDQKEKVAEEPKTEAEE
jgi:translation initiation factor IF-3